MRHPHDTPEPTGPDESGPIQPPVESAVPARRRWRPADELWEIERLETTPMTPDHYETAVSTLATLISHWLRDTRGERDDQAA
ncbi:hypothetical protein GCM10018954_065870 [Kutzneria kofuensis]